MNDQPAHYTGPFDMTEGQAKALLAQVDADTIEAIVMLCHGSVISLSRCVGLSEEASQSVAQPIIQSVRDYLDALKGTVLPDVVPGSEEDLMRNA